MDPQLSFDLWADVAQILQFHFMQNALEAGTIAAVMAGVTGYFMVLRGQSFAGHTLSQVGFPGAAGAALVGAPPLLGFFAFCTAGALAVGALSGSQARAVRSETAAIGAILAFALALGYLFTSLSHGFIGTVYSFLFGTFVGISDAQVVALLAVAIVTLCVTISIGRPLLFASVDPDAAFARGVPVRMLSTTFLLLLGFTVAAASYITGALLVFALLVAPAAAAQQITARPGLALVLSVGIGIAVTWMGLGIAYFTPYPIGFFVTTMAFGAYLCALGVRRLMTGRPRTAPA